MERKSMHAAAREGNIAYMTELLRQGTLVDQPHHIYPTDTPLIWAAFYNNAESVAFLLDRGADINHRGEKGGTPLHWAVTKQFFGVALLLLRRGADPFIAADDQTTAAYHLAAARGDPNRDEADMLRLIRDRIVAIHPAAEEMQAALEALGAQARNPRRQTLILVTGIALAAVAQSPPRDDFPDDGIIVESSISPGDFYKSMHAAARFGDIAALEDFLRHGRDVDAIHHRNREDTPLVWAAFFNAPMSIIWLVEHDADIDHVGEEGRTPLHWALEKRHYLCAALLLSLGANHLTVDHHGMTPAQALLTRQGAFRPYESECIMLFRRTNISFDGDDPSAVTARQLIDRSEDHRRAAWTEPFVAPVVDYYALVVSGLIEADPEASDGDAETEGGSEEGAGDLEDLDLDDSPDEQDEGLAEKKEARRVAKRAAARAGAGAGAAAIEPPTKKYQSVHAAARAGDIPALEEFLRQGRDVNELKTLGTKMKFDDTPLIWAAYFGQPKSLMWLLEHGATINHRGEDGGTPLYWATKEGNFGCALILLNHGADHDIANAATGRTAMHVLAERTGILMADEGELIIRLIKCGVDLLAPVNGKDTRSAFSLAMKSPDTARLRLFLRIANLPFILNETTKDTLAHVAAAAGYVEALQKLLSEHPDLATLRNMFGHTPIHAAVNRSCQVASSDLLEVLRFLMAHGGDINAQDTVGRTPLHHAAASGNDTVTAALLSVGADVHAIDAADCTALHCAVNPEVDAWAEAKRRICERLLEKGARQDALNIYGIRPLERDLDDSTTGPAIARGVTSIKVDAKYAAAFPTTFEPAPVTPFAELSADQRARAKISLHEAARAGDLERVDHYIKLAAGIGHTLDAIGLGDIVTPMERACIAGRVDVVQRLLNAGSDVNFESGLRKGWTPLFFAVAHVRRDVVTVLLQRGAKLTTSAEGTVFHLCAARNDVTTLNALLANVPATDPARALELTDATDATAFQIACDRQHVAMVRRLLELGAQPNIKNLRADKLASSPEFCEILLKAGVSLRNSVGLTLQMAAIVNEIHKRQPAFIPLTKEQKDLVKVTPPKGFFYKAGDSTKYQSIFGATRADDASAIGDFVYNVGHIVDRRHQNHADTPLIWAAYYGRPSMCALLVELGCDVDLRGEKDGTALYWAVKKAYEHCAVLLLYLGANPAIPDDMGATPLHVAARHGLTKTIIPLLNYGAPINDVDDLGNSALHYAAKMMYVGGAHVAHPYFTDAMSTRPERHEVTMKVVTKMLCESGINRSIRNKSGELAIDIESERVERSKFNLADVIDTFIAVPSGWSPLHHDAANYEQHHAIRAILMLRSNDSEGGERYPTCLWNLLPLELVFLFFETLVGNNRVFVAPRSRESYRVPAPEIAPPR